MTSQRGVISYPTPIYQNVPIEPQFYQPRRFVISDITRGQATIVTTSTTHDYVIGQQVKLIIPVRFGSYQLNESFGYVIDVPSTTTVVVLIDSTNVDAFIPNPYTATITNIVIDSAAQITVTSNNSFTGGNVIFSGVSGMTEINDMAGTILTRTSTAFTVAISTTFFSAYIGGGIATLYNIPLDQAQILAIGDINSGVVNSSGRTNQQTYINGSFIDISPA